MTGSVHALGVLLERYGATCRMSCTDGILRARLSVPVDGRDRRVESTATSSMFELQKYVGGDEPFLRRIESALNKMDTKARAER